MSECVDFLLAEKDCRSRLGQAWESGSACGVGAGADLALSVGPGARVPRGGMLELR